MFGATCPCCVVYPTSVETFLQQAKPKSYQQKKNQKRFTFQDVTLTPEQYKKYSERSGSNHSSLFDRMGDDKYKILVIPYSPPTLSNETWEIPELKPIEVPFNSFGTCIDIYKTAEKHLRIPKEIFTLYKSGVAVTAGKMVNEYGIYDEILKLHPELTRSIKGEVYRGPIPEVSAEQIEANKHKWPEFALVLNQEYDTQNYLASLPPSPQQLKLDAYAAEVQRRKQLSQSTEWKTLPELEKIKKTWKFADDAIVQTGTEEQWKKYYSVREAIEKKTMEQQSEDYQKSTKNDDLSAGEVIRSNVLNILEKHGAFRKLKRANKQQEVSKYQEKFNLLHDSIYLHSINVINRMGDIIGARYFVRVYSPFNIGVSIDLALSHMNNRGWSTITDSRNGYFIIKNISDSQALQAIERAADAAPTKNNMLFVDEYHNDESDRVTKALKVAPLSHLSTICDVFFGKSLSFSNRRTCLFLLHACGLSHLDSICEDGVCNAMGKARKELAASPESDEEDTIESAGKNQGAGKSSAAPKQETVAPTPSSSSTTFASSDTTTKTASTKSCAVCGKSNKTMLCSRCKNRRYCSKECQVADWKTHKTDCKPTTA